MEIGTSGQSERESQRETHTHTETVALRLSLIPWVCALAGLDRERER